MSDDNNNYLLEERKKRIKDFLKNKTLTVYLALLAIVIWIASWIRTRNLYGLKDVTTGGWTLGPDLDPFLFLRWAKYIVEHGSIMAHDIMRYAPVGYDTSGELNLITYSIVWFHKIISIFGTYSVEYAAVIVPVVIFALVIIACFFFVREIFRGRFENKHLPNIIALLSSFFISVIPSLLPRTIAGIPEKEGLGFLFMFIALYFYIKAWNSEKNKSSIINSVLAGIGTALMAHSWGGVQYLYITIALATLFSYLMGVMKNKHYYVYCTWVITSLALLLPFTGRFTVSQFLTSTSTGMMLGIFGFLVVDYIIKETRIEKKYLEKYEHKIPRQILSMIIAIIISVILVSISVGPSILTTFITESVKSLIYPYSDRLSFTVAENRQPFFTSEWRGEFGPNISGIPIFFWLFFIGSIYLFYQMTSPIERKKRITLVGAYTLFLFALIFSKYSGSSVLNGTSGISRFIYFGGIIILLGVFAHLVWGYFKRKDLETLTKISFSEILLFTLFFITILGSRSAIRLMMVLGIPAAIIVSYFIITITSKAIEKKNDKSRLTWFIIAGIILIAAIYTSQNYYMTSYYQASSFVPNTYTQQWQKAMSWVRDNTPEGAIFAHWWDYGYWVQSIGLRATIVDGGNAHVYWNYLVGRHFLTSPSKTDALEFLYTHEVTHVLIDSTDIGKYSAFSNIGSDENYDRASFIPLIGLDQRSTQETANSTTYLYQAGFAIEGDIIYNQTDGQKIFLPAGRAGIAGVLFTMTNESLAAPEAVFVDQGIQYRVPLRYVYYKQRLYDFGRGLEAGIQIIPTVTQTATGIEIMPIGSALYLSPRTINSNLVRLYLFGEEGEGFNIAHSEDDQIVTSLKQQGADVNDFVNFNGLRGPIKIWEVDYSVYPGIKEKPEYLELEYPDKNVQYVKQ
ncbi:MAG: STT3 domain-containing protein [Nanoarchaeota archaeon]